MDQFTKTRLLVIKQGLELEMHGVVLTKSAPKCFSIIKKEFGIKTRDKSKAYKEYCEKFGFDPKAI